jgi:hypothetical protein
MLRNMKNFGTSFSRPLNYPYSKTVFHSKAHAKSREERRWHGTTYECNVGDPNEEDFCDSPACQLCQTISRSFGTSKFKSGVHTSKASSRWVHPYFHSDSLILTLAFFARSSTYSDDVMLLVDVCFGDQISLARDEIPPEGFKDYDTVSGYRLTFYRGCIPLVFIYLLHQARISKRSSNGQSSPVDDVIVCQKNAIRPSYLVFYG